jgi:hypothetical protein
VLNALRAGVMLLANGSQVPVLTAYIRGHSQWTHLLQPLAQLGTTTPLDSWPRIAHDTDTRLVQLNSETITASYDPLVLPNMLLLVQAGLPFPPRNKRAHSLQGLARACTQLSSGANMRQELPLLLERVAAFRGRDVLVAQNAPSSTTAAEEEDGVQDAEGREGTGGVKLYTSASEVVAQGADLSPHEKTLLGVIQNVSALVLQEFRDQPCLPPHVPCFRRRRGIAGRQPTMYESRAAFLMLFGETHHLYIKAPASDDSMSVAVTVAGSKGRALLVQRLNAEKMAVEEEGEGDAGNAVGAEAVAQFGFLQDASVREEAKTELLAALTLAHPHGIKTRLPKPPHGFQWAEFLGGGVEQSEVHLEVRVHFKQDPVEETNEQKKTSSKHKSKTDTKRKPQPQRETKRMPKRKLSRLQDEMEEGEEVQSVQVEEEDGLRFFVQGREVEAFNAAALLEPCNEATTLVVLEAAPLRLIRQALYALDEEDASSMLEPSQLLHALQCMASEARMSGTVSESVVYDWVPHVCDDKCAVPKQTWRDVLLTITTRDKDTIDVAPVNRLGSAARQAVRPMSEGTVLRILFTLEALYPSALARTRSQFRWRVMASGAAFVHMCRALHTLATSTSHVLSTSSSALTPAHAVPTAHLPTITTELWAHQSEARDRVLQGIRHGKLGGSL